MKQKMLLSYSSIHTTLLFFSLTMEILIGHEKILAHLSDVMLNLRDVPFLKAEINIHLTNRGLFECAMKETHLCTLPSDYTSYFRYVGKKLFSDVCQGSPNFKNSLPYLLLTCQVCRKCVLSLGETQFLYMKHVNNHRIILA